MKKGWTVEEERLLLKYHEENLTIPEIAQMLKRSKKSVESKLWTFKQINRV
jgi:DNA-directed RNA polymerase specialized sigma24 family protein